MSEHKKSSTNWNGLAKGILAGGAIIAGLVLVAPGTMTGVWESITKIGAETAKDGVEPEAMWGGESFIGKTVMPFLTGLAGSVITKIGGIALAITGLCYLTSEKKNNNAEELGARHAEAKEAYTLREDIRRTQAKMQIRMSEAQGMSMQQGAHI